MREMVAVCWIVLSYVLSVLGVVCFSLDCDDYSSLWREVAARLAGVLLIAVGAWAAWHGADLWLAS